MRNILIIIRHEILAMISKPFFWVMIIVFPLFIVGLNIFTQATAQQAVDDLRRQEAERMAKGLAIHYVDEAYLIQTLPLDIPAELFVKHPTRETAQAALRNQETDFIVIIPANYMDTGNIYVIQARYNPLSAPPAGLFLDILTYNLAGDELVVAAIRDPLADIPSHSLAPVDQEAARRPGSEELAYMVPLAVMVIFFLLITMGGGFMLRSVSREKENRTVEVLLASLNPRQIMIGKIIGMSLVALIQMLVWVVGGLVALRNAGQLIAGVAGFQFPPGFLVYAVVFFLLGYLMYAAVLGALGALAPGAKEAESLTFLVILPLLIPVWFNPALIQNPDGMIAVIFSLAPFTSPVAMLTRMAIVEVPLWQIAVSLASLAVTTYLMVILAARFFRADTLLSTSPIKKEFIAYIFKSKP